MRNFLILCIIVVCTMTVCSCGFNQKNSHDTVDSTIDSVAITSSIDSSMDYQIMTNVVLNDGRVRVFYQTNKDDAYQIYTKIYNDKSSKPTRVKTRYFRYEDNDLYTEGTPTPYFYTLSPDCKYLYVVAYAQANSNGWVTNYQLFRIDCNTLDVKLLAECAAVKATKTGFTVARGRLTNESQATITAEEIWLLHDENYDWHGQFLSKSSHEYDYDEMEKGFESSQIKYTYVTGFNVLLFNSLT